MTQFLNIIQPLPPVHDVTQTADITLCICAMDRRDVLRRCLQSIAASSVPPAQVIVSDDSRQPELTQALCAEFAFVQYVRGPQRGLCANRNSAMRASTSAYLSFLDDDALLAPDFVAVAAELMETADPLAFYTGDLLEGVPPILLVPGNPTFWGHFGPARPGARRRAIHINSNLIPRTAFARAAFDENLFYGYDEMDICSQFLAEGYHVEYRPALHNGHIPPPKAAAARAREMHLAEAARFYTTLKRYLILEQKPVKAALYILLAPMHRVAYAVKTRQWADIPQTGKDMRQAISRVVLLRRSRRTKAQP